MEDNNNLKLNELRDKWQDVWGIKPTKKIGRKMLERSLEYKYNERKLTTEQNNFLNRLVKTYKQNTKYFEQGHTVLKTGMKILKDWNGKTYTVTVTNKGFEYLNKEYSSLSKIATEITGTRWNGWLFFGLKNKGNKL